MNQFGSTPFSPFYKSVVDAANYRAGMSFKTKKDEEEGKHEIELEVFCTLLLLYLWGLCLFHVGVSE